MLRFTATGLVAVAFFVGSHPSFAQSPGGVDSPEVKKLEAEMQRLRSQIRELDARLRQVRESSGETPRRAASQRGGPNLQGNQQEGERNRQDNRQGPDGPPPRRAFEGAIGGPASGGGGSGGFGGASGTDGRPRGTPGRRPQSPPGAGGFAGLASSLGLGLKIEWAMDNKAKLNTPHGPTDVDWHSEGRIKVGFGR